MNRSKKSLAVGIGCLVLLSISTISWADVAPCEKNFTVKEGFFGKKIYKTWQDLQDLMPQTIFKRAYAFLVKEGWVINFTDKETGVISALQQDVSADGGGKVAPLNIFIENAGNYLGGKSGGTRVTMTFSIPGGLHAQEDMVRKNFCDALAEIKKGSY